MTKYVVSGYIGFDNFGDEAIAKVLVSHLKKIGAKKITLISSNPQKTSQMYDVDSCKMLSFFKPILHSDVLISGGGSLLQDVTSLKSLLYYLSIILFAKICSKKVIIFAQGFTPFRTRLGKLLTQNTLKLCDKIYVRDLKSKNLLKKFGIHSDLISDPVYGLETPSVNEHKGVGIQLRSFPLLDEKFLDKLVNYIEKYFPNEEIKLYSLQDSIDLPVLETFSKKLAQKGISSQIYKNLSVENVLKEISELEYLIAMRFHACLVAAKAGVKVLGINYDIKVLTLAENIKFPIIGFEEKDLDEEFEQLFSLNVENYKKPEFIFSEIL